MAKLRKSFEDGHVRKFLVIIDSTNECNRSVCYAAKRAARTNGALIMLHVITPGEFQHWIGVENIMRSEAHQRAEEMFKELDHVARKMTPSVHIEHVIREGVPSEEIKALIDADEDIAILVLAAGVGKDGPGPLVTSIVGHTAGNYPVPVTIVPGNLSDQDISSLA